MLFQTCAVHKFKIEFGDVSSAFLQTESDEQFTDLKIRVPDEVANLLPDSMGRPSHIVKLYTSSGVHVCHHRVVMRVWAAPPVGAYACVSHQRLATPRIYPIAQSSEAAW